MKSHFVHRCFASTSVAALLALNLAAAQAAGGLSVVAGTDVHKLNQCGSARASIYRQGLGEFFMDDLYRDEAALVVPTAEAQARLAPELADNARIAQLNTPAYSVVAYPWAPPMSRSTTTRTTNASATASKPSRSIRCSRG